MIADVSYRSARARLAPGESIFLFTDGINEAANGAGEQFGDERLARAITLRRGAEPQAAVDAAIGAVQVWAGDEPQSDDITAMVVVYRG